MVWLIKEGCNISFISTFLLFEESRVELSNYIYNNKYKESYDGCIP